METTNEALAKLGSDYRVLPGTYVHEALYAVVEAIPGYIDRQIKAALDARETKE